MRTPAGRHVKPLESTGTIFGDHFDQDDAYRLRRPHGMKDWLLVYTRMERAMSGRLPERNARPGQLAYCAPISRMNTELCRKRWNFLWIHYPGLPENRIAL